MKWDRMAWGWADEAAGWQDGLAMMGRLWAVLTEGEGQGRWRLRNRGGHV